MSAYSLDFSEPNGKRVRVNRASGADDWDKYWYRSREVGLSGTMTRLTINEERCTSSVYTTCKRSFHLPSTGEVTRKTCNDGGNPP